MSEKERLQLENECLMKYSKAQMIQKYIDELEESSKLSELWCKSQEENRKLQQENQELKLELSGYRQAILEDKDMLGLKEESEELKKKLEEINKMIKKCGFVNIEQVMLNYCGLLTQQKEFISYLEEEIKIYSKTTYAEEILKELEEILKEYKKIIGVSDENKTTI